MLKLISSVAFYFLKMWLPENTNSQIWLAVVVHIIFLLDSADLRLLLKCGSLNTIHYQVNGIWFCGSGTFTLKRFPGNSVADCILSLGHSTN